MQSRFFPKWQGLAFAVDIAETSPGVVTVPDFDFELQGEVMAVAGGEFPAGTAGGPGCRLERVAGGRGSGGR